MKPAKGRKKEKGIAILFTLGILSLILVVALAFASTAMMDRKIAANSANSANAKLIAETGLARLLAVARLNGYNQTQLLANHSFSSGSGDEDFVSNISCYDPPPSPFYIWDSSTGIEWEYIEADGKIIGRFAYALASVADEAVSEPIYDPSELVEHPADALTRNEDGLSEDRIGVDVNEINIGNLGVFTAPQVSDLSCATAGGQLTDDGRWVDFTDLNTKTGILEDTADDYFVLDGDKTPEAFWLDLDADDEKDPATEQFDRFNLARTDWDDLDDDGIDGSAGTDGADHVAEILSDSTPYSAAETDGSGITWLTNFGKNDSGADDDASYKETFADVATRRKQIAANLIDYSDSDNVPTSDVDPAAWDDSNRPTYTGIEKTPQISELSCGYDVLFRPTLIDAGTGEIEYYYDAEYYFGIEIMNPYETPLKGLVTVRIVGDKIRGGAKQPDGGTWYILDNFNDSTTYEDALGDEAGDMTFDLDADPLDPGEYRYKEWPPYYKHNQPPKSESCVPTNNAFFSGKCEYTDIEIDWEYDTNGDGSNDTTTTVDYVHVTKTDTITIFDKAITPAEADGINQQYSLWFSMECDDPRQNLNTSDWTTTQYGPVERALDDNVYGTNIGTPNAMNSGETSASSGDAEQQVDDGVSPTVSTAYVRNAPMVSPWELGAIHRGAKWETLNISTFNAEVLNANLGPNPAMGATSYTAGDANILDQIKMSDAFELHGKVNVNTGDEDMLRAMLQGITVGDTTYGSTSTALELDGAALTEDNAVDIGAGIDSASLHGTWVFRSNLARAAKLSNGSVVAQAKDRQKEEIIGKLINLTKGGPFATVPNVIVLAQAIEDIGTETADEIIISRDLDGDGTLDGADETRLGYDLNGDGDALDINVLEQIGTKKGRYDLNADEILAQTKIRAHIYYDEDDGNWYIFKYKYLD